MRDEARQAKREYERKWRTEKWDKEAAIKRRYWKKQAERVREYNGVDE